MQKQAGTLEEALASAVTGAVPYVGGPVQGAGAIHGLVSPAPSVEEEADWNDSTAKGMIPGVSSSRLMRRVKRQLKNDRGSSPRAIATLGAPLLHNLIGALGGAAVGGVIGARQGSGVNSNQDNERGAMGAVIGAVAGSGLVMGAHLIAAALAGITDTRTRDEQREEANKGVATDYLVPGVSTYNYYKSLGRSMADESDITSPSRRPKANA
jgi:hypothetical protein